MRITFLSWRDPGHPDGGGSEVYVEEIASRLASRGHAVTIRCARYPGSLQTEERRGVRYQRRGGRLSVYAWGLLHLLSPTGRRQDVVVDVINGLPFGAVLVRRRGLVALVHHLHREQWRMIYPGLGGKLGWFIESQLTPHLYRSVPHITVSDATRDGLHRLGVPTGSIAVVRNGRDQGVAPSGATRSPTPRLCVLSRLVPHKQIEHALEVLARLRTEFPELGLDIIGSGWWEPRLREHSLALAVDDLVTWHGHVPEAHRDDLLAQAWLALLPSTMEGWGLAVTEAAAQGTPTLAYRSAGGVNESVLDGHTGALAADLDDMVGLVRELLVNEELRTRLSAQARQRAAQLDWDDSTDAFEGVLAGIRGHAQDL